MGVEQSPEKDFDNSFPTIETRRLENPGAEKWLGKVIPVLDHGFVYLADYMGSDEAIEQSARVSYGKGTRKVSETRGLIRYLMRHRHTSPFEMAEMKFHARMPISVARQWVRHRTANLNEYSARYSILKDEFYVPEPSVVSVQSLSNRQGRGEAVNPEVAEEVRERMLAAARSDYELYSYLLNDDGEGNPLDSDKPMVARELARNVLPVNVYTEWYWKIDLHNLLHFLSLRMDEHAQWEIRQYANVMGEIVKDSFPLTWEAFEDYRLNATSLSAPEQKVLQVVFEAKGLNVTAEELKQASKKTGLSGGERRELGEKLAKFGIVYQSDK